MEGLEFSGQSEVRYAPHERQLFDGKTTLYLTSNQERAKFRIENYVENIQQAFLAEDIFVGPKEIMEKLLEKSQEGRVLVPLELRDGLTKGISLLENLISQQEDIE